MNKKKDPFIKLTDFGSDRHIYIDPEEIKEIAGLPATEKHKKRTSVATTKSLYLVKEDEEQIHILILTSGD